MVNSLRFPASLSLSKVAGTPQEKADVFHEAALEQSPSLGFVNTGPLAPKASKELLTLEYFVTEVIWQKPAAEYRYRL
jgi:hypothetical protein